MQPNTWLVYFFIILSECEEHHGEIENGGKPWHQHHPTAPPVTGVQTSQNIHRPCLKCLPSDSSWCSEAVSEHSTVQACSENKFCRELCVCVCVCGRASSRKRARVLSKQLINLHTQRWRFSFTKSPWTTQEDIRYTKKKSCMSEAGCNSFQNTVSPERKQWFHF